MKSLVNSGGFFYPIAAIRITRSIPNAVTYSQILSFSDIITSQLRLQLLSSEVQL